MRILFLVRRFWPSIGGVETHVGEISQILIKKGHYVTVIAEKSKTYSYNYQSRVSSARFMGKDKVPKIYEIPASKDNWFKKFRLWIWLLQHRSLILDADIVHCHDVFFWYLPFRLLYPKKPVFTTFHGYETKYPPSKKAILVRKLSEKLSRGTICVGDFIKRWYGTKPDFVTYGGVNSKHLGEDYKRSDVTSKLSDGNNIFKKNDSRQRRPIVRIGFVGRLEEDTGIPLYLETLRILKNIKIQFEFIACGDGSLRSDVQKWGRVTGFVYNLYSYIKDVHMVFTSSYLSILYLLSIKKPVHSIYSNPLKEDYLRLSPFSRYVIICSSAEILARQIVKVINHPNKYAEMIESGYRFATSQTWQKVVDMYLLLWKKKLN